MTETRQLIEGFMESHTYVTGFEGGPCPVCGYEGRLWETHCYLWEQTRVLVHGDSPENTESCTMPLEGILYTTPDGTWRHDPERTV